MRFCIVSFLLWVLSGFCVASGSPQNASVHINNREALNLLIGTVGAQSNKPIDKNEIGISASLVVDGVLITAIDDVGKKFSCLVNVLSDYYIQASEIALNLRTGSLLYAMSSTKTNECDFLAISKDVAYIVKPNQPVVAYEFGGISD